MRRNPAQLAASCATKATREGSGSWRVCANWLARSAPAGALNEIARVKMRPSTSGSTMFIARSAPLAPRFDAAQASRVEVASAACNTGASARSSTQPSTPRAEKAVVFTITSGLNAPMASRRNASLACSFKLATKAPSTAMPRAARASASARIGAWSSERKRER